MSDYEPKCKKTLPIIFDDRMPVNNLTPKIVNRVNNNTEDLKNLYDETESQAEDIETLQEDLEGKIDVPQTAGTSGQVLTSDGEGGVVWADVGSGEIVVDPTLTVEGAAADAKAVGDQLTLVKQDISELSDETIQTVTTNDPLTLTVTENYYHWGSAASSSSYGYVHITDLLEGDIITAHASASDSTSRQWRFTDAYNGDTRVPGECIDANRATITIPSGVDNVYLSMETRWITTAVFYLQRSTDVREIVPKGYGYLMDIVDINEYEDITPRREDVTWTTGYIEPSNGNIYTGGAYDSYNASSRISVQEGDVVTLFGANGVVANMRTVAAWYNNAINASAGVSSNTQSYTVPSGVDQIAVTGIGDSTGKWFNVVSSAEKTGATPKKNSPGYAQAQGSLSSGGSLSLPVNDVKLENVITFSGRITSFSSIKIGKNASGYPYATIDGTNLVLNNGSTSVTVAHGLTIANDIQVTMFQNVGLSLEKVEICSSGEEFIYSTPFSWEIAAHGAYYVQSVGSVLTDCVLSWTNKKIDAPVWVFGDSYISMSDPARWPYYAVRDGLVKSTMFNGFAGEGSADAFASLLNLLECRIPKVVVWTMGMNNGDSSSAVNATWKSYYDMVVDLSKKYGFELVLYTVPTCPAVNNNFKNAIVRDSGYRYIDADAAVRIAGSTNWISGTLNPDNTHPTEKGAKILYHRVIADLPEMANDN